MNVTEAHAAQVVLAWIAGLRLVETTPAAPSDEQLLAAVAVLADRSHRTLHAGFWREDALAAVSAVLTTTQDDAPATAGGPALLERTL